MLDCVAYVVVEMKGIVIGKKINEYTKNSEKKIARTLYVIKDEPKNPIDGMEGRACEELFVPFDIPAGVGVGVYCDFEYEIQQTRNGAMARLVDIIPLKPMLVEIRELK